MDAFLILRTMQRRWRLVAFAALLGLVLGAAWATLRVDYVSSTSILLRSTDAATQQQLLNQPARYVDTQVRVLESGPVLSSAAEAMGGAQSVEHLKRSIDVSGGDVDNTINVVAKAPTGEQSRQMAAAISRAYVDQSAGGARILWIGGTERTTSLLSGVAVGVLGGGVFGVVLALALGNVSRRVDGPDSLIRDGSQTVVYPSVVKLGRLDHHTDTAGRPNVTMSTVDLERLAAWLLHREARPQRLLVTSLDWAAASREVAGSLVRSLNQMGVATELTTSTILPDGAEARTADDAVAAAAGHVRAPRQGSPDVEMTVTEGWPAMEGAASSVLSLATDQTMLLVANGSTRIRDVHTCVELLGGESADVLVVVCDS